MDENLNPDEPAVTDLLGSLCEPGYAGELAGEQAAVAAFAAAVQEKEKGLASRAENSPRRPFFFAVRGAKLAAAAMVGSLVMGGVAAAAFTGSLPGPFQDIVPSISLRENERGTQIGSGWDPQWHQPTDVFTTYSDKDFRLGLNAAQTTLGAVATLTGAKLK